LLQESPPGAAPFVETAMATSAPGAEATTPLQGVVLYIEDVHLNFVVVEGLLAAHPGVRLLHAATGRDGVEQARNAATPPDVVLLDMHLPDISGIEVVRMLSEDIAAGRFRVILITADRLNIDVLKAMSLGAFEYLEKPVSMTALEASLRRALQAKAAAQRRAAPP
jgi:CheY-like chemotaxis protein